MTDILLERTGITISDSGMSKYLETKLYHEHLHGLFRDSARTPAIARPTLHNYMNSNPYLMFP